MQFCQQQHKPYLFIAIQKNDIDLTKYLLYREINLNTPYTVSFLFKKVNYFLFHKNSIKIKIEEEELPGEEREPNLVRLENILPYDYAKYLGRWEICSLIEAKMSEEPVEVRWLKIVEKADVEKVDKFRSKFQNPVQVKALVGLNLYGFVVEFEILFHNVQNLA